MDGKKIINGTIIRIDIIPQSHALQKIPNKRHPRIILNKILKYRTYPHTPTDHRHSYRNKYKRHRPIKNDLNHNPSKKDIQ